MDRRRYLHSWKPAGCQADLDRGTLPAPLIWAKAARLLSDDPSKGEGRRSAIRFFAAII